LFSEKTVEEDEKLGELSGFRDISDNRGSFLEIFLT
jgi:hypothetical protein